MPSFLSKVFSRKKEENEQSSLLEGSKYERVEPPTPAQDSSFSVPSLPAISTDAPHLSLNLPSLKSSGTSADKPLSAVFESSSSDVVLLAPDQVQSRQLTPLQSLLLVRACAAAITSHGLDTLGLMHPNWHSASPESQFRLISLFIRSLDPSPSPSDSAQDPSKAEAFESEIRTTRSAHDVASVLKWGLRHLKLEGKSFGKNEEWYKDFLSGERKADYPTTAFSTTLVPLLPPAHHELLVALLGLFQSLAAHGEWNGLSGSKLSKLMGLWLLEAEPRARKNDSWSDFYTRWEVNGRKLEHVFLSLIRYSLLYLFLSRN
jgi:hypothetical protein